MAGNTERRLATVLVADAVGFSRRMGRNEDETLASLIECRALMSDIVAGHRGKIIGTPGDFFLAIMPSGLEAIESAIEIQTRLAERNRSLDEVRRAEYRIGVGIGDIREHQGDVLGDAVNVASRLSHVAVKGQIITARDTVMLMSPMLKSATRKITNIQIKGKAAEVEVYELMWQQSGDATTMAAARSVYKPKKTTLKLILQGKEHLLSDELTAVSMGRDATADLVIKDRMASRSHGKIERRLDKFVLSDHSANGTFVTIEGDREIVLRREEFTLRGHGWIAFGQPRATATDVIEFFCE